MKLTKKFQNPDGPLDVTYIPQTDNIQPQILERPRLALPTNYVPGVGIQGYIPINSPRMWATEDPETGEKQQHHWLYDAWKTGD